MKIHFTILTVTALSLCAVRAEAQTTFYPESYEWYRLVSYSSASSGEEKCIQLTPRDATDHPGELWSGDILDKNAEDIDYQYFIFEQNPENSEEFAMICVAAPGGYVDPTPTQYDEGGRWKYVFAEDITDESSNKYGFVFKSVKARNAGYASDGVPYYAIATDSKTDATDWLMNYGGADEDDAIDISAGLDPSDPDNSLFKFEEKRDIITQNADISISGEKAGAIYSLSGIRVVSPQKGLYISGGRIVAY